MPIVQQGQVLADSLARTLGQLGWERRSKPVSCSRKLRLNSSSRTSGHRARRRPPVAASGCGRRLGAGRQVGPVVRDEIGRLAVQQERSRNLLDRVASDRDAGARVVQVHADPAARHPRQRGVPRGGEMFVIRL